MEESTETITQLSCKKLKVEGDLPKQWTSRERLALYSFQYACFRKTFLNKVRYGAKNEGLREILRRIEGKDLSRKLEAARQAFVYGKLEEALDRKLKRAPH